MSPKVASVSGVLKSNSYRYFKGAIVKRLEKIGEKLVVVPGAGGTRIWPPASSKNDSLYGLRIDRGSTIHDAPHLFKTVLQVNKETTEGALKSFVKASNRGTHAKVAEAIIDTTKPAEERVMDMLEQFDAASDDEDD